VPTQIEQIAIEHLQFDPQNPRLSTTLQGKDERAVLGWMLHDAGIIDLMRSIGEQGFFPGEPILVVPAEGHPGKYSVVEGNRRLAAAKLLLNPDLAPTKQKAVAAVAESAREFPRTLPALIYSERREILKYLGFRHITGVKEWDPLAKARYLDELRETVRELPREKQHQVLAKEIGSRSDYVAKQLAGLRVYEKIEDARFFDIPGLTEESFKFATFTTALNYNSIAEYIGLADRADVDAEGVDQRKLERLTTWMFRKNDRGKTALGESRNLSLLADVVVNQKAVEAFDAGASLQEAHVLTTGPSTVFREAISSTQTHLQHARDTAHQVNDLGRSDYDRLTEIFKLARATRSIVEELIEDEED
jgi:hypothetical protein